MTVTNEDDEGLTRAQRRLLRRIFNGRSDPIVVGSRSLLTFKDASQYLVSLPAEDREATYAEIKVRAKQTAIPPA